MTQAIGYPKHIAANGAVQLQGKFLLSVTVNTKGGTGNTLTIYDGISTSGDVIAIIDTATSLGTFLYDIACLVGLHVVLAGGTPADLTLSSY